jgi:hypothetical protein
MTISDLPKLNHQTDLIPFVEALGVRLEFVGECSAWMPSLATASHTAWAKPPDERAHLVPEGSVRVAVDASCILPRHAEPILHEVLHVLLGPSSLEDETLLLPAMAWIVQHHAKAVVKRAMRKDIADYYFFWMTDEGACHTSISSSDKVFASGEWCALVDEAKDAGILRPDGSLALRGPHPNWSSLSQATSRPLELATS